jgi:imidazolonepropionase-like amidohydrolase
MNRILKQPVMLIIFTCIFAVLSFPFPAYGAESNEAPLPLPLLVLKNATLIDGVSSTPQLRTLVIKGSVIHQIIDPSEKSAFPEDAFIMNLDGHFIIPGLIDGHVHISHDSRHEVEMMLKKALLGGITSVRDMGGDGRILANLKRDALLGQMEAPNIYFSALMAGPTFFTDPRVIDGTRGRVPGQTPWACAITPDTDISQVIAEAKGCGASGIKIYADLPPKEIARLTQACRKQGLKTWSHGTIHPAGPMDAVLAGVETLSHAPLLAWHNKGKIPPSYTKRYDVPHKSTELHTPAFKKLFQQMKQKNTILDATVYVFQLGVIKGSKSDEEKEFQKEMAQYAKDATAMVHKNGIKISAGTDFLLDPRKPLPNLHEELEILVKDCGLTPFEAIKSATAINAEVIGIQDQTGTVEAGKQADLVVLAADPTSDITHTRKIRYVIKGGKIFVRQSAE